MIVFGGKLALSSL